MSFASALHDLQRPAVRQPAVALQPAPPQEFTSGSLNTDVTNPAPPQRSADQIMRPQPEPPVSAVPRTMGLEDEIL